MRMVALVHTFLFRNLAVYIFNITGVFYPKNTSTSTVLDHQLINPVRRVFIPYSRKVTGF